MDHAEYSAYLQSRSRLGGWYRRYWLYPRLSRHLRGYALDVGCGIGDMLDFRPQTVGVDINSFTVQLAQSRGLDARLMTDAELPFGGATFDSAIMDNVLEHIASPQALLSEVRRVLKPDGTLVVGVPGRKGYARDPDHKVFYDRQALADCLSAQGFAPRAFFHMPLALPWLDKRMSQYFLYGVFGVNAC